MLLHACPHLLRGFGDMNMTPQAERARLDRHIAQKSRRAQVWRVRPQPGPNTPVRLPMPACREARSLLQLGVSISLAEQGRRELAAHAARGDRLGDRVHGEV